MFRKIPRFPSDIKKFQNPVPNLDSYANNLKAKLNHFIICSKTARDEKKPNVLMLIPKKPAKPLTIKIGEHVLVTQKNKRKSHSQYNYRKT